MAQDFGVIIEGATQVALRFDKFPADLHDALKDAITKDTTVLEGRVREATPARTGRLRSQIDSAVFDDKTKITGAVFVSGDDRNDFAKAGALEYGAHGTATVKAHAQTLTQVFGVMLDAPMQVMVEAYTRQTNIVAHRFMRNPFSAMESEIEADLREVVDAAAGAV
jgi:hypothetical protein